MRTRYLQMLVMLLVVTLGSTAQADWLRFRGPNGTGVSNEQLPEKWSPSENVKWKVPIPGPGSSSPIVVGDRVFLTCYTGYGIHQESPGDQKDLRRHLLCINRLDGSTIWTKTVQPVLPEDPFAGIGMPQHGYASHTPVSDGQRVYAFFGKTGVFAFDMEGKQLWQQTVGTESGANGWGSSSSPILYKNLLIVPATAESEAMVALDKLTGEEQWRQEAAGFTGVWGSPILVKVNDERSDLVIAVPNEIWALNPDTGKMRWYSEGVSAQYMCSSAVAHDGVVYAMESGPSGGGGVAVKAGGKQDVTASHLVWKGGQTSRVSTPVIYNGRLYAFANRITKCYDLTTGDEISQSRLSSINGGTDRRAIGINAPQGQVFAQQQRPGRGGPGGRRGRGGGFGNRDYGSPVIAAGKLYFQARSGDCYVFATGDQFERLAVNKVTSDSEDFSATPAISDGALFIRSNKHLYCVASD